MLFAFSHCQDTRGLDQRRIRTLDAFVRGVRLRQSELQEDSLDALGSRFHELCRLGSTPQTYNQTFVDAAAIIACAVEHIKGFSLHDVQISGAAATASGSIIEMQTGEGKTIVSGVAALLRSVFDQSVHVATTTDYLAERDHEENRLLFEALHVSSSVLQENMSFVDSRNAYRCHITYGPGYLFGFDYLRDQTRLREFEEVALGREVLEAIHGVEEEQDLIQYLHQSLIVDEADSVMIDEATTPLILSEPNPDAGKLTIEAYQVAEGLASDLRYDIDYEVDLENRSVSLTSRGEDSIYETLQKSPHLYLERPWGNYIESSLYARFYLKRNEHYVVQEGRVKLVDQHTGRIFDDRQLRGGLHQAVEAKENLAVTPANLTTARLTRQTYFGLYDYVCGMTGSISGSEAEIEHFYGASVAHFPPHHPSKRKQLPSRFFASWDHKLNAIVEDIAKRLPEKRPILVGARTIKESLAIANALRGQQIECVLLNGVQDADEADIVAGAGRLGALTIATNMAGRGTDIKLSPEVRELGGLHVICTQHHSSARIDRQLLGRCARQGDPGSYQFFAAADDDLFETFSKSLGNRIHRAAENDGEVYRDYSPEVLALQTRIEGDQFELRRNLVRQDQWLDEIRESMVGN